MEPTDDTPDTAQTDGDAADAAYAAAARRGARASAEAELLAITRATLGPALLAGLAAYAPTGEP